MTAPPRVRVCPVCEKEYDSKDRQSTYIKITTESGFDTIRIIWTCSWSCKAKYEEKVKTQFQDTEKFHIAKEGEIP